MFTSFSTSKKERRMKESEDSKSERRKFKMHPQLLFDVIRRQAGTAGKAILEGMMNSADAKATECRITLTSDSLTIVDNGSGFKSRADIEDFFETFGTPHSESENKTYGTFRMGRGQLFAFGENVWESGTFRMKVDIKKDGLDYDLTTLPEPKPGCSIKIRLYDRLLPSGINDVEKEIRKLGKYIEMSGTKCYLNGEKFTSNPEEEKQDKWDLVTDEAFIKLRSTSSALSVFNMGAFVKDYGGWQFGTGGEIVSRKQLQVNFARNDIMLSSCKVWKKIRPVIDHRATEENKKKKVLTDHERQRLADQIVSGDLSAEDACDLPVLTDVNGRHWSLKKMNFYQYNWKITVAPAGDRRGDMLHQQKVAFVFSQETLDRFGVKSLKGLVAIIGEMDDYLQKDLKVVPFADLTKGMSASHFIVEEKKYTLTERVWMRLCSHVGSRIDYMVNGGNYYDNHGRKVVVGISDSADAWTDGKGFVAVNRKYLSLLAMDFPGVVSLCLLLLHEYEHKDADLTEHNHSMEFYQSYHDDSTKIDNVCRAAFAQLPLVLKAEGKKATKGQLKNMDQEARLEETKASLGQVAASAAVAPAPAVALQAPAVARPEPAVAGGNPYKGVWGTIYEIGSKKWMGKKNLIEAVMSRAGVSEKTVRKCYEVLRCPTNRDNHGRSKEVTRDSQVRLVRAEE
jgi:hypothetical protein